MPKTRLYKCKHCDYETSGKEDNWNHIRIHIKPERLLTCDSCKFVTEHKHHLKYHQCQHEGIKPFKCDSCDYQCINKSMLNSHMKSHSSVYQYQCEQCKYSTKYVHSLKTHFKKYNHFSGHDSFDPFDQRRGSSSATPNLDSLTSSPQSSINDILDLRVDSRKYVN